jgi:glycine/D-amino acid oxidase-like deaminating enzyme
MQGSTGVGLNGGISFWYSDIGGPPAVRRPSLTQDLQADVCIVGAGFTGLWTAYHLARQKPDLKIAVLEREFAGFGASGRNGGNMTGRFPWSREVYRRRASDDRLLAFEKALRATPAEIMRTAQAEGIDADFSPAGHLNVATTLAQRERLEAMLRTYIERYGPDEGVRMLEADELAKRVRIKGALCAVFQPQAIRVQPAKLVRGLAQAVERRGVTIYEGTAVAEIAPRKVRTETGHTVTADAVIRATEGFTPGLPGAERDLIPLNSAIIVTEPAPPERMAEVGWEGSENISEISHGYNYCQRTREGRITVGGRGVPYRFGSGVDQGGRTQDATIARLKADLERLFPSLADLRIDQAWCGVLGVPRDWCSRVNYDPRTGLGWAGAYVGTGVTASNLAGRTLADLILERPTELTTYPWVNFPTRRWEPEPLRWLGVHAMYQLYGLADRQELGGGLTSPLARLADRITGRT